jgi:hypothetical protein
MEPRMLISIKSVKAKIVYNLAKKVLNEYKDKPIDLKNDEQLSQIRRLYRYMGQLDALNHPRYSELKKDLSCLEKQPIFPSKRNLEIVK